MTFSMDARRIAEFSLLAYANILKRGKPDSKLKEWTTFTAIVLSDSAAKQNPLTVISMATGTKCVGYNEYEETGCVIHDSHSEVLARRAFLRYIYHQIKLTKDDQPSIFEFDTNTDKFMLKNGIGFHMFLTQSPCGDASIFPMKLDQQDLRKSVDDDKNPAQKCDSIEDIHRTGAKCIPHPDLESDKLLPGTKYHNINLLRLKPGRGYRSLSMSCSDKIMRWNILGLQGALLYDILKFPIYLESITICGKNADINSLRRAVVLRMNIQNNWCKDENILDEFKGAKVELNQIEDIEFVDVQHKSKNPSPNSIVYCSNPVLYEIIHNGYPAGVTKRNRQTKCSQICKKSLFDLYKEITGLAESIFFKSQKPTVNHQYIQARSDFMRKAKNWTNKKQIKNKMLKTVD